MSDTVQPSKEDRIEAMRRLVENQRLIETVQHAISNAPRDLNLLRSSLEKALDSNAWCERFDNRIGREVRFQVFKDFVEKPPLEGLGTDLTTLRRLLGPPDECPARVKLEKLLGELQTPGGANNPHGCKGKPEQEEGINHNSVMIDSPEKGEDSQVVPASKQGNSAAYAVRRLSRERPDLLERVTAGEMSANAAMIEAGFRKVPTPLDILRKAWAKASEAERQTFLQEINAHDQQPLP